MKVFVELPVQNRGLQRVYDALVKYAPKEIEITKDPQEADLTVIHVYGRHDSVIRQAEGIKRAGKQYAVVQYCVRSTMNPSTADWIDLWNRSKVVWSYYDLAQLAIEDKIRFKPFDPPNFYHAPLGVEADVFKDKKKERHYIIATCSPHALAESVKECVLASKRVGRRMFHLGHDLRRGDSITSKTNISDEELADFYSQCEFVSGLRRVEGFELPAVEGLLCGARPILFDKPHYRKWYEGLAVFIEEGSREEVVDRLEVVFRLAQEVPVSVTEAEKAIALKRFNWSIIIGEFYNRILA